MEGKRDRLIGNAWSLAIERRLEGLRHGATRWKTICSTRLFPCSDSAPSVPSSHVRENIPTVCDDDPSITANIDIVVDSLTLQIRGQSLLVSCPCCQSPMTVRLWLMTADCWRCESSLELTETQRREVMKYLPSPPLPGIIPNSRPVRSAPSIEVRANSSRYHDLPETAAANPTIELERLLQGTRWSHLVKQAMAAFPAWLVSFLFHLFLILVLAMILLAQSTSEPITLVLSTFLDSRRDPGGEVRLENPQLELADDSLPAQQNEESARERDLRERAEQDAAELTIDPQPHGTLPPLSDVRRQLLSFREASASFLARDPRIRAEIVAREGGTTMTEAAVARGLRWLASVQNRDGSWSLANYDSHDRADNRGDSAATSLALLPFLGAGQTHERGIHKQTVARGLAWLLANQKPDGDLRINFQRPAGMYAHGQATIVLCEAYAMTGDERFRQPAQMAIDFIQRAQHREGGWRYEPGQPGDTSVFGWQLMALHSARASSGSLKVDPDVLTLADYYLDLASVNRSRSRQVPDGALYRYLPREGSPTAAMTAEAILCRMYLGWRRDDPRLMFAIQWLLDNHLPNEGEADIYYWYYATQVMHHYGGPSWQIWNAAFRDRLVQMQETSGKHPGSWNPKHFRWGSEGERIFVTAMAICTLEVYYRHLPIFRPLKLD